MLATEFLQEVQHKGPAEPDAVRWLQSKGELPNAWVRWLGGFHFELLRDFRIEVDVDRTLYIEAGFTFDGASVPRLVWRLIAPVDLGVVAPLCHDHLYRTGGQGGLFTRKEADRLFLAHMEAEGIGWWRRHAAYLAVRTSGRGSWQS